MNKSFKAIAAMYNVLVRILFWPLFCLAILVHLLNFQVLRSYKPLRHFKRNVQSLFKTLKISRFWPWGLAVIPYKSKLKFLLLSLCILILKT
jgi:hypothetical protein